MKYLDVGELVKNLQDRAGKYDEYDWHGAVELEAATTLRAQAAALEELATLREKVKVAEEELIPLMNDVLLSYHCAAENKWRVRAHAALAKLEEGK